MATHKHQLYVCNQASTEDKVCVVDFCESQGLFPGSSFPGEPLFDCERSHRCSSRSSHRSSSAAQQASLSCGGSGRTVSHLAASAWR